MKLSNGQEVGGPVACTGELCHNKVLRWMPSAVKVTVRAVMVDIQLIEG